MSNTHTPNAQMAAKENFHLFVLIDLFTDTAAILISIVSNIYYGMPRGQIHINLHPEHPIMSSETIEIKMAAVSAKRSIRQASLILKKHFFCILSLLTRPVGLISTRAKQIFFGRRLFIWSMIIVQRIIK